MYKERDDIQGVQLQFIILWTDRKIGSVADDVLNYTLATFIMVLEDVLKKNTLGNYIALKIISCDCGGREFSIMFNLILIAFPVQYPLLSKYIKKISALGRYF